ncbi:hypothetical protein DIZ27_14520 [Streptomyces sp. NWU339]|uniref:hypothetical protein n=1 Tax=Streptomyces sp. NWU339 TaxID=2185284 RepID=UPI000D678644|nr:hypothetical protein [Streptomyces sp. NWU339]PWI09747.1 hypothetical protein DIZ27_14520 [Streptomyces sp. NWU339]
MRTATSTEVTNEQIVRHLTSSEVSNLSVAQALGVPWGRVNEVRQQLGLETYQRGRRVPEKSWEEAVRRRVKPVSGGHAVWTGNRHPNGTPVLSWRGRAQTAYRAVFRMHYGREPEGKVSHSVKCKAEYCVAGWHLEDRVIRARRRAPEGAR